MTDIVKKNDNLPSYLQGFTGQVDRMENIDSRDLVLPAIKQMQGLSPELETFDFLKPGMWFHNVMDVSLGFEFEFVVARASKKFLLTAPLNDGQGVLARANDAKTWDVTGSWEIKLKNIKKPVRWTIEDRDVAKSGLTEWGTSNPEDPDSPPAATAFYDFLVYLPEFPDLSPCVLSCSRSKIKNAKKQLVTKLELQANFGRPMQAMKFKAVTYDDSGAEGPFKNVKFLSAGFATEEEFTKARGIADLFRDKDYKVHDEASLAEEGGRTTSDEIPF